MSKDKHNGANPSFDFSRVPRAWRKKWLATVTEITEIQARLEVGNEPTKEQMGEIARDMRRISELADAQQALVAQVVTFIPSSMVHPDAPLELDWSEPESYDWLTDEGYQQLVLEMQTSRRDTAKN